MLRGFVVADKRVCTPRISTDKRKQARTRRACNSITDIQFLPDILFISTQRFCSPDNLKSDHGSDPNEARCCSLAPCSTGNFQGDHGFWLLGMFNNCIYCVILAGAKEIVAGGVGIVFLAMQVRAQFGLLLMHIPVCMRAKLSHTRKGIH